MNRRFRKQKRLALKEKHRSIRDSGEFVPKMTEGDDDRHCLVRSSGYEVERIVDEDDVFLLHYIRKDNAVFVFQYLDSSLEVLWSMIISHLSNLFGFSVYFCLACGRFIGFDNSRFQSVCWLCEGEFEDDM